MPPYKTDGRYSPIKEEEEEQEDKLMARVRVGGPGRGRREQRNQVRQMKEKVNH
jgi:hypothetical protein